MYGRKLLYLLQRQNTTLYVHAEVRIVYVRVFTIYVVSTHILSAMPALAVQMCSKVLSFCLK